MIVVPGCRHNADAGVSPAQSIALRHIDTAAFISSFCLLSFDTLVLYTDYAAMQHAGHPMIGTLLDTSLITVLPDTFYNDAHAVGRFDLSLDHEGFLVRHWGPDDYDASRISLFVFDKKAGHFLPNHMLLAESWGDAGDYFSLRTVIRMSPSSEVRLYLQSSFNYYDPTDSSSYRYANIDSFKVYTAKQGGLGSRFCHRTQKMVQRTHETSQGQPCKPLIYWYSSLFSLKTASFCGYFRFSPEILYFALPLNKIIIDFKIWQ
ncbi:MAG: hypothetical protein JWO03_951 [Bacteroidetes bacterium]|nr:hypothetical protein [Bacteroidota bacterium]